MEEDEELVERWVLEMPDAETMAKATAMHRQGLQDGSDAFEAALPALATGYSIHVEPLPASVEVAVSREQAEDLAVRESERSTATNIKSMLVSATNTAHHKVQADGTLDLVISNRTVWLVLLPDQQARKLGREGQPTTYPATLVVLIDANSGDFLEAAALAQ